MIPTARVERSPFYRGGSASKGIVLTLPLLLHDIHNKTSQRFREEVRRLVGHALAGRRDGLHFADFCRVEQQGSGSRSLRHPIQGFMIILRIEDGLLFLLRRAESRDDELLEQRHVELGARRGLRGRTMGWLQVQRDVTAVFLQRQPEYWRGSSIRPHRLDELRARGRLRGCGERKFP